MPHKIHPAADPTHAYRAYAIYADYGGDAPDTENFAYTSTEELAKEVCEFLNRNPEDFPIAFVDGCESSKSFQYRECVVANEESVKRTFGEAIENFVDSIDLAVEVRSESGTREVVAYGGESVDLLPEGTKLGRVLYDPERDVYFNEAGERIDTKRVSVEHLAPGDVFSYKIDGEKFSAYEFRSISTE